MLLFFQPTLFKCLRAVFSAIFYAFPRLCVINLFPSNIRIVSGAVPTMPDPKVGLLIHFFRLFVVFLLDFSVFVIFALLFDCCEYVPQPIPKRFLHLTFVINQGQHVHQI